MVCALNAQENSYPGDTCPPGYFAYGRLDAIDTEFMRMEEESLNTTFSQLLEEGAVKGPLRVVYDGVSHYLDRYNPMLQADGYFISSRSVVDTFNGALVASNTRIETFHVSFWGFLIFHTFLFFYLITSHHIYNFIILKKYT